MNSRGFDTGLWVVFHPEYAERPDRSFGGRLGHGQEAPVRAQHGDAPGSRALAQDAPRRPFSLLEGPGGRLVHGTAREMGERFLQ
jgi:hypothetical protein